MPTIAELLDINRKTLLDLSTRNRLLNIPQHAKSARVIHVHDELTSEVWRILVSEKKDMSFLAAPDQKPDIDKDAARTSASEIDEINLPQPNDADLDDRGIASRHRDRKLQTKLTSEKLQRRLLDIFYDARTFIEEQGVNILYLALGKLHWFEDEKSEIDRNAPLILLPVKLERRSAAERFYVSWTEDDAQENLSLVAKLKSEFGITLPEFKSGDEFEPSKYIDDVATAVKGKSRWEIYPNAITLGFFSFAKFLMYRDLDPANWISTAKIDENSFIISLLRDGFTSADHPIPDDLAYDVDTAIPVERLSHVADADSSQALAIEAVRRGRSLVIQGPPGTGKSQTITNLIASAVADGKTVLFVAEKLAALSVVKRRLDQWGLGDMVIELHSNKAQKRAVLAEFKKVLERGKLQPPKSDGLVQRLTEVRNDLNSHAKMMNEVLQPSGLSVQQVIGHLTRLGKFVLSYGKIPLDDPESWSADDRGRRYTMLQDLVGRVSRHGLPHQHPWRGVRCAGLAKMDADRIIVQITELHSKLSALRASATTLAECVKTQIPTSFEQICQLTAAAALVASAPDIEPDAMSSDVWAGNFAPLRELIAEGRRLSAGLCSLGGQFAEAAWSIDFRPIRADVALYGRSLFRFLNRRFRRAIATAQNSFLCRFPKIFEERMALLDEVVTVQTARHNLAVGTTMACDALGKLWSGETTNWDAASRVIDWMESAAKANFPQPVRLVAARVEKRDGLATAATQVALATEAILRELQTIVNSLELDLDEVFGNKPQNVGEIMLDRWSAQLNMWRVNQERLNEWFAYNSQKDAVCKKGLSALVQKIEAHAIPIHEALSAFDAAYYETLFRAAAAKHRSLLKFDGDSHHNQVAEFREIDKKRVELARVETLMNHAARLPTATAGGAIGLIRGEIEKKRNHMPLRRLFKAAAPAIQAIKPVFMMSPLSVAQYLDPGSISFDLLLMDEASQIEPVDALGAIARAKQLVVVGDDKQLPPTRFFMRMTSEEIPDDEEGGAQAADIESILGLCVARGLPQAMLRWHYRSRHQSLIAVSNRHFYDGKLFIVPSPQFDKAELGVKLTLIKNGIFDRGGSSQNKVEARAVAEAVIYHARKQSQYSLGVAAFSLKQAQAIRDELELLRRQNPDTEAFFNNHPYEPFFVKNLENVQGDERDVIFISVGYGKDSSGYMAMSFGPLNFEGGERRLNVLISRAKRRCEVFSSITADDIDLERARGVGVSALKVFLKFAETGQIDISDVGGRGTDSPFEDAVKAALESEGYDVRTQVGIAGFFIDLTIVDPDRPGRYLLGIECDGATYHACRAARDRDRLRQQVLEDHGWRIHRIWSADWFNQPKRELTKVISAIDAAKNERPPVKEENKGLKFEFVTDWMPERSGEFSESNGVAPKYVEAKFPVPSQLEPHEVPLSAMVQIVQKIVEIEGPIHQDEIVARVRMLWGLGRAGNRIREAVAKALRTLRNRGEYVSLQKFWRRKTADVIARDRSQVSSIGLRKPEHLPFEELQAAVIDVVKASLGASSQEIPQAVARRIGFAATSAAMRDLVNEQIKVLLSRGLLDQQGDLLVIKQQSEVRLDA